jgi:spore germination cell wall hydrolase CwlJ-like protein
MQRGLIYLILMLVGAFVGSVMTYTQPQVETKYVVDTMRVDQSVDQQAAEWMARAIYSERKLMSHYEYNAWVIRNRLRSDDYPNNVKEVVLQDRQFSAFNTRTKRHELRSLQYPETKDTHFRRAYRMAKYVLSAPPADNPLPMVTHFYHRETLQEQYGKQMPEWAKHGDLVYAHGQARYYKNVRPPQYSSNTYSR